MVGGTTLFIQMSLDFDTVLYACEIAIPASFLAGFCGYLIGKIAQNTNFIKPKESKKSKIKTESSDLVIDDLLADDMKELSKDGKSAENNKEQQAESK